MSREISNTDDMVSFDTITERVEALEDAERDEMEETEYKVLVALLKETCGYGGDHQWRGDWYPGYMVRDSHFEEYAQTLAEDIGAIDRNATWPLTCIDWAQAARELQMDYSTVEYDGVTFWYR